MEFGEFGISCKFNATLCLCCVIKKYRRSCIKILKRKLDEHWLYCIVYSSTPQDLNPSFATEWSTGLRPQTAPKR